MASTRQLGDLMRIGLGQHLLYAVAGVATAGLLYWLLYG
jgi:hypothetical protein